MGSGVSVAVTVGNGVFSKISRSDGASVGTGVRVGAAAVAVRLRIRSCLTASITLVSSGANRGTAVVLTTL